MTVAGATGGFAFIIGAVVALFLSMQPIKSPLSSIAGVVTGVVFVLPAPPTGQKRRERVGGQGDGDEEEEREMSFASQKE